MLRELRGTLRKPPSTDPRLTTNAAEAEETARDGIVLVRVDYFHYGKFRYTNLKDAIAQAKREHPSD